MLTFHSADTGHYGWSTTCPSTHLSTRHESISLCQGLNYHWANSVSILQAQFRAWYFLPYRDKCSPKDLISLQSSLAYFRLIFSAISLKSPALILDSCKKESLSSLAKWVVNLYLAQKKIGMKIIFIFVYVSAPFAARSLSGLASRMTTSSMTISQPRSVCS